MAESSNRSAWTLLTSHGHVLVEIARDPTARIRELSAAAGITERATAAIIADLVAAGYVTRHRVGRRNHYSVNLNLPFRHTAQRDLRVGPFLELLVDQPLDELDRADREHWAGGEDRSDPSDGTDPPPDSADPPSDAAAQRVNGG